MALLSATHTASATASEIAQPVRSDRTPGVSSVEITNTGEETAYIGGAEITSTSGGIILEPGQSWYTPALSPHDAVYCCTASGSSVLYILWIGA